MDHEAPRREDGGDLLIRGEFTFPGDEATSPPDEAIDLIRAYVRTATLRPVVRLRTIRRMIRLLDLDDRLLGDVVDDEVSVLSGRRIAARFRELEVEITDDTPDGLLDEVSGGCAAPARERRTRHRSTCARSDRSPPSLPRSTSFRAPTRR